MVDEQLKKNEAAKPEDADVAKLRVVFPDCFTKNGAIDFEKLQAKFDGKVKIENEGYRLDFLGKSYARLLTALETTTVVKPDLEHNQKPENAKSRNVYLTADNLDALKQLVKSYAGEVKMIYIDPPYNTGSDGFVYNDKFNFTEKELCDKLGVDEQQAKRILGFAKRNASSHSAWLTFMYPRLMLARELLTKDGVIFISIDDNEQANLKLLCDDVFGEEKFIGIITTLCNPKGRSQDMYIANCHEYILIYGNGLLEKGALSIDKNASKILADYPLEDEKGRYRELELRNTHREFGKQNRPNMYYPVFANEFGDVSLEEDSEYRYAILPIWDDGFEGCWTWDKIRAAKDLEFLVAHQKEDEKWVLYRKSYAVVNGEVAQSMVKSIWLEKKIATERGQEVVNQLFETEEKIFQGPKSPWLLRKMMAMMPLKDGDIVVDFFSGSGTFAHAVLESKLNGLDVSFVMAQLPDPIPSDKPAYAHGFRTIDEIGRKRIELAAEKIRAENPEKVAALDLGFKHYTLVEPSQETLDKVESFDKAASLVGDEGMLKEFGLETVLATWMVRDGYGFGVEPEVVKFGGYAAYWQGKHLYFVKDGLGEQGVKELMDRYETDPKFSPVNVVVFGYGVSMTMRENLKTNLAKLVDSEKDLKVNIEVRY